MELSPELELAISELEELAQLAREKRRAADRYDVRGILIGLGDLILQRGAEESLEVLTRVHQLAAQLGSEWDAACQSELALACSEHIYGVDPRYLKNPKYDFKYTIRGRELLEARLIAAHALKISIEELLLHGVQAADERLQPYLE